jgi:hypothetical protein
MRHLVAWRSPASIPASPVVRDALTNHALTGWDCLGLIAWPAGMGAAMLILGVLLT